MACAQPAADGQLPGVKDPFVYLANSYPGDERQMGELQLSGTFVEVLLQE